MCKWKWKSGDTDVFGRYDDRRSVRTCALLLLTRSDIAAALSLVTLLLGCSALLRGLLLLLLLLTRL